MKRQINPRKQQILKDFLLGCPLHEIMQRHHLVSPMAVNTGVRDAINVLNLYSVEQYPAACSHKKLAPYKEAILAALDTIKTPSITITYRTHDFLVKNYGIDYPTKAAQVAKDWEHTIKPQVQLLGGNVYSSIVEWLASEGECVDNALLGDFEAFIYSSFTKRLEGFEAHDKSMHFKVEKTFISRQGVNVTLSGSDGEHTIRKTLLLKPLKG